MGLSPMHRRGAGDATPVAQAVPASDAGAGVGASPRAAPAASLSSRGVPPVAGSGAARVASPVSRPGALLEALRHAAGGRDVADLVADLERLRREPALKRALWPRLRALRRH